MSVSLQRASSSWRSVAWLVTFLPLVVACQPAAPAGSAGAASSARVAEAPRDTQTDAAGSGRRDNETVNSTATPVIETKAQGDSTPDARTAEPNRAPQATTKKSAGSDAPPATTEVKPAETNPVENNPVKNNTVENNAVESKPGDTNTAETNAAETKSADAATGKSDTAAATTQAVTESIADTTNEAKERIVLLAPTGPLVIDVRLRFGGKNIEQALQQLVDEAMRVADEDGDGMATWMDVANNPRFRSGQYGNLSADTDEERQQLIRIYDADNDGMVDREEVPRFLTRNAGGGRSFSLRSSNEFRGSNRRRSPTRLLIDEDRDGAITAKEMEAAPGLLAARDADDDGIIVLAELKDSAVEMVGQPQMMASRRRVTEPDTAIWLTDKSIDISKRWGMVQFQLQELYSYGERLHAGDWPMTQEMFRKLDADADGELSKTEIAGIAEAPPHLVLDVNFDVKDGANRAAGLKLHQMSSEFAALQPQVRELPNRISIQLADMEVEFLVNEDPALNNLSQSVKAQFQAMDRNKNGYLEAEEVPNQVPGMEITFAALDADGDGKVYEADFESYYEQRTLVQRAQVRSRAADQEDALFTALDSDGDARLNAREIRQAPAKLKSYDRNGDGRLQADEIPGSMIVAFVRGNPQQDDQLFSATTLAARAADRESPRWFRGMDANADGEISVREFFGTAEKFDQLDTDHDRYVSLDEARALEPQAAKAEPAKPDPPSPADNPDSN